MRMPKKGRATLYYSKAKKDFLMAWGEGGRTAAHMFHNAFNSERPRIDWGSIRPNFIWEPSYIKQLEEAGYDTKTLKITIDKK